MISSALDYPLLHLGLRLYLVASMEQISSRCTIGGTTGYGAYAEREGVETTLTRNYWLGSVELRGVYRAPCCDIGGVGKDC